MDFFFLLKKIILSILLFFYLGFGVFSPVFAYIAGGTFGFLIFLIPLRKYFFILKYKIEDFLGTKKKLFVFGIPLILTEMGKKVIFYIDILILSYFFFVFTIY